MNPHSSITNERDLRVFKIPFGPLQDIQQIATDRTSGDGVALVIKSGDAGEVGGPPEDSVEGVCLFSGLSWGTISGELGPSASAKSGRIGLASIYELVARELGDDVDILSRAVVIAHCV